MLGSGAVGERAIRVMEIGWKARRFVDGVSAASVVAALSRSLYLDVAGEIVWLGPPGSTLHGRAIIADVVPRVGANTRIAIAFDLSAAREWRSPVLPPSVTVEILTDAGRRLIAAVDRLGAPDGVGALLVGRRPAFPLDHAVVDARGFLAACARDEPATAAAIAERLLGLGPGLTPAGDDLIGGAFFFTAWGASNGPPKPPDARRAPAQPWPSSKVGEVTSWTEAAAVIRARAAERTHRISAALLGDLLDGDAYAPLHDLADALARNDDDAAIAAAERLTRIGHSSGWDMLTGFLGRLIAWGPRNGPQTPNARGTPAEPGRPAKHDRPRD